MFIIIPLALIGASLLGIGVVIVRKLSYTRKLSPEVHETNRSLFHDFFPELTHTITSIRVREYIGLWLQEVEKLIRKVRILFSRVDRLSDSLLKRIRNVHQKRIAQEEAKEKAIELEQATPAYVDVPTVQVKPRRSQSDMAVLHLQEQQLIVEVAHDPKNPRLYRDLGDIYFKMRNFEDAKESFTTALKFNPIDEIVKKKLTQVLQKLESGNLSDGTGETEIEK